ncbi:hypothetical protein CTA2_3141 [Colletotrichum tanaceti]|uniref:Methyltransferase domain-containing protein n=1 Tax=Colletotrichum tanaceti TaxID=1306861 RepID=A0A4U6XEK4_9PEZI|nr:hypothetical protein CTA2_3141 [Colletotrichum tanaceti]TKW54105.1 hypothetical protein CTA1_7329 [Colletotrichum tanaceti]
MEFNYETQAASAQRMYTARADKYKDSFHQDYTKRFMAVADVRPGENVLILACGTGLEVFAAADRMGVEGEIVGVDAFDAILYSSAFVLFDNPGGVVRSWRRYLKPEGRLVVDVTHEDNLKVGLLLERAARRLGARFPSNRSWITDRNSITGVLEGAGYVVERVQLMDKLSGQGDTTYGMDQVDEQFDCITGTPLTVNLATEEFKRKTRDLFREEWEKAAVDGKVVNVDAVYVYVARRA